MVAAGALVTPGKTVRAGELWTGWPASFKRPLSDKEIDMMTWTRTHYAQLAKRHAASLKD